MDRPEHNINTNPGTNDELEETLRHSWQTFVQGDDDAHRDDLDRIKKRIDTFIDGYEQEKIRRLSRWHIWGKIAAVLVPLLIIGLSVLIIVPFRPEPYVDQPLCVVTGDRERATVILPDGTDVSLNSDTRLSYGSGFTTDSIRSVSLTGEAYFNVAKDAARPFVISLDNIKVRVLGTSFNVRSLPDGSGVGIALVEGAVELIAPDERIILSPGNVANYDPLSNTFVIEEHGCHLATGWMRHEKSYVNVSPDSLIEMLEHEYGMTLSSEARASIDDAFTGTLPDNNPAEILTILSEVYNFDIEAATLKIRSVE